VTIRIEPLDACDPGVWDHIVTPSKFSTVFHSKDWLKLCQAHLSPTPRPLVLLENEEPVGVFAGSEYGFLGLKGFFSPAPQTWTFYGGLLVRDTEEDRKCELWQMLMSSLLREYSFVITTDPPTSNTLGWCQYQTVKKTLVVQLSCPVGELWSRTRRDRRRGIKSAEQKGVHVVECDREDDVKVYYDMLRQTRERKRYRTLLPLRFFSDVLRTMGRRRAKLYLAMIGDMAVAGAFLLLDDKRFYCWSAASREAGLALGANSLIQWKAILWGKENGFVEYDMLGANIPSVASFKAGFGSEYRKYYSSVVTRPRAVARIVRWSLTRFANFGSNITEEI
jgi:hypothetical protein